MVMSLDIVAGVAFLSGLIMGGSAVYSLYQKPDDHIRSLGQDLFPKE